MSAPLLSSPPPPLPVAFFARPTAEVARDLLGKLLVRRLPDGETRIGRVTEVEAYLGLADAASHARRGPTPRSAIMFGPPGRLYVYLIYGMHHCMNLVAHVDGVAGAVLVRAADLLTGPGVGDPATLRGPGKLCAGLGITLADKGIDVTSAGSRLCVVDDGAFCGRIDATARVGVAYAGAWARRKLRFVVRGAASVSEPRLPRRSGTRLARRDRAGDRREHGGQRE